MSVARLLVVATLVSVGVGLAACGDDQPSGGSGQSQASSVAEQSLGAPSDAVMSTGCTELTAEQRARYEKSVPPAAEQATNLVEGTYPDAIARLRKSWGTAKSTWTATEESQARWRAVGIYTGNDASERLETEWIIHLPLDSLPTCAEMERGDADGIDPANAAARELIKEPELRPGRTVSMVAFLMSAEGTASQLALSPAGDSDPSSMTARRADALIEAAGGNPTIGLEIDGTELLDADGKSITAAELRRLSGTAGPMVEVVWELDRPAKRLTELERAAPKRLRLLSK